MQRLVDSSCLRAHTNTATVFVVDVPVCTDAMLPLHCYVCPLSHTLPPPPTTTPLQPSPPPAVEDVKLALLSCLSVWLPKCGTVPPAVVQQLASGLSDPKEALRKGNLKAALVAVNAQPGLAAQLGPLAAPLAKLVSEGCAKAVARADGIAALLLAAQVAAADSTAGAT